MRRRPGIVRQGHRQSGIAKIDRARVAEAPVIAGVPGPARVVQCQIEADRRQPRVEMEPAEDPAERLSALATRARLRA